MRELWSFYDRTSGIFTGQTFSRPLTKKGASVLLANIPPGCDAFLGEVDHLSQRMDLQSGRLVDYRPPQPSADHEWNDANKRWRKRADVVAREVRRAEAMARIADLERRQLRPLRELLVDPTNAAARTRLAEIDAQIAELRRNIGA